MPSLTQLSPDDERHYRRLMQVFVAVYALLIIAVGGIYVWHHGKPKGSANNSATGLSVPIYSGIQSTARNSKRQVDIQSLQTQLEAYFSQNGYYPSLTDMNTASWRATNLSSLDSNSLVDPLSTCNPATSSCLKAMPGVNAYAYSVTDSNGKSCETDDTKCVQYTLTATYEGAVNGANTYTKSNLD